MHGISYRDIHLYPLHTNSSLHLMATTDVQRSGRITDGMWSGWRTLQDSALSSPTSEPTLLESPCQAWVRLNRLRTGVGRVRSCLHKWGMAPSAACECGEEEQTIDPVLLQ